MDRIDELRRTGRTRPVHVQLILSDLCNQDCSFCAYRISNGLSSELFVTPETRNPNRKIPTEKALEIVDDCRALGVKAIQFTGGGEPTVHKDHLQIFGRAQSHGIETALVTNGVRLSTADPILAMQWIRVSVDAGTPETYQRVRRVAAIHWRMVWGNIEALAKQYKGVLGIGFVVTPDNYQEVGEAARLAKNAGATNLRVGAVFSADGMAYYGNTIPAIAHAVERAKSEHDGNGFEVVDLFGRRLGDLEHRSPTDPFCGYQHLTLYIGADLTVYRCCNTAYTKAGILGNLTHSSLARKFSKLSYHGFDATACRYCQFLGQNAAIAALIKQPQHSGFV